MLREIHRLRIALRDLVALSAIPGGIAYVFFRHRGDVREMAALEANVT